MSLRPPILPVAGGFTYIGILILIAVISLISTVALHIGKIQQRRSAENELLAIGMEFRNALIAYANATPPGTAATPQSLQDLLKDPRFPSPRRYLRKLYIDPMTGKTEWGILSSVDGAGIVGVYSLSTEKPIKIGNFPSVFEDFEGKAFYREWKFVAPQNVSATLLPRRISTQ